MLNIVFDSNILLDVLLRREPWVKHAAQLWQAVEDGKLKGYLVASTATDIFYITRRASSIQIAHEAVQLCLLTFDVVGVDRSVLEYALTLENSDFEDNVQIACTELNHLDGVVTRDPKGYTHAKCQIWDPIQLTRDLGLEEQT